MSNVRTRKAMSNVTTYTHDYKPFNKDKTGKEQCCCCNNDDSDDSSSEQTSASNSYSGRECSGSSIPVESFCLSDSQNSHDCCNCSNNSPQLCHCPQCEHPIIFNCDCKRTKPVRDRANESCSQYEPKQLPTEVYQYCCGCCQKPIFIEIPDCGKMKDRGCVKCGQNEEKHQAQKIRNQMIKKCEGKYLKTTYQVDYCHVNDRDDDFNKSRSSDKCIDEFRDKC